MMMQSFAQPLLEKNACIIFTKLFLVANRLLKLKTLIIYLPKKDPGEHLNVH